MIGLPLFAAGRTGENVFVRDQQAREERTLAIATALAVMLGTLAIGILGIVAVGSLTDMSQAFNAAIDWVAVVAFAVGIGYLILSNP
jgi:hypothetical protein